MLTSRQKTIFLNIVASPFFLALPIAISVIFFLPNPSSKYKIELSEKVITAKPICQEDFCDLNNDGIDERVVIFHNIVKGEAALKVLTYKGITYDQWNFYGHFQKNFEHYFCADLNMDGFAEIYLFYFIDDSVFMGAVQPYPNKEVLFKKKFVTNIQKRDGNIDYSIASFQLSDIDNDGFNEMVFVLNAGFSRQPRCVFIYDFQDDSFRSSKSVGAHLNHIVISDLNNDSMPEIYCGSDTPANIQDSMGIPFNDYSSWFMGFDKNLDFLFSPIEQNAYPSTIKVRSFTNSTGKKFIAAYFTSLEHNKDKLVFYTANGVEYSSVSFSFTPKERKNNSLFMESIDYKNKPFFLIGLINGYLVMYNEKLEVKKVKTDIEYPSYTFKGDLNKDGNDEYILRYNFGKQVLILDSDLRNPVLVKSDFEIFTSKPINIGIKHNSNKPDELFVKSGDYVYLYTYSSNYLYYFKYLMWLLVYGTITMLLWFSQRIQNIQTRRKQLIEETINSLQIKTIKSQMDPHFMFNVLNGLANNVAAGNTGQAYDQILRFSKLLRSLMRKTDRIDIGLKEELEFVKSYLELEKFRFKDNFEFSIEVGRDVNLNTRIPRMLIQLLVENGIKHGLRNKAQLKQIWVKLLKENDKIRITVEDNGIGRKEAMKKIKDTGRGQKLLGEMIRLNKKLGGKKISIKYIDLYNENGKASGTRVEIGV